MISRLMSSIRNQWHPLWRLRQSSIFRGFQRRFDFPIYTKIPKTDAHVAVMLMRDISWILVPKNLEPEIHEAFKHVLELCKPTTFWDIGANIGFYSWYVRTRSSIKHVVMFEPDPTNYRLICRTIDKNRITNCEPMNMALSNETGTTSFLVDRVSGATGSLCTDIESTGNSLHHDYRMKETITCKTATVDGLIAEGVTPPQFIKIDVEGAEHLVVDGALSCLTIHHPTMIVETSNNDLIEKLQKIGYSVFRIDGGNLLFISEALFELSAIYKLYSCIPKEGV